MARVMADVMDAMDPVREAATGLRARLEADGYSPSAAEYLSVRFLAQCMKGLRLTVSVEAGTEHGDDLPAESGQS
jgi:hypothetical protein